MFRVQPWTHTGKALGARRPNDPKKRRMHVFAGTSNWQRKRPHFGAAEGGHPDLFRFPRFLLVIYRTSRERKTVILGSAIANDVTNLSGMLRRSASLVIPHHKSFAAIRRLVAHDCGYPLSRYTCRATRVAADFLDFIAFCRCSTGVALHPLKILVSHLPPPRAERCRTEIWV